MCGTLLPTKWYVPTTAVVHFDHPGGTFRLVHRDSGTFRLGFSCCSRHKIATHDLHLLAPAAEKYAYLALTLRNAGEILNFLAILMITINLAIA